MKVSGGMRNTRRAGRKEREKEVIRDSFIWRLSFFETSCNFCFGATSLRKWNCFPTPTSPWLPAVPSILPLAFGAVFFSVDVVEILTDVAARQKRMRAWPEEEEKSFYISRASSCLASESRT